MIGNHRLLPLAAGAALLAAMVGFDGHSGCRASRQGIQGRRPGRAFRARRADRTMDAGRRQGGGRPAGQDGGAKFTIVGEDSQWDAQKAVNGYNKLTNVDHVDFMLSGGSTAMEAIAPLATQDKMVIMNVGAQSSDMAGIGPYVFSVLQLSNFDTGVLSHYALTLWATRRSPRSTLTTTPAPSTRPRSPRHSRPTEARSCGRIVQAERDLLRRAARQDPGRAA